MKALLQTILRIWRTWRPPSKAANLRHLQLLGEQPGALKLREATVADVSALGYLHAKTWSDTYPRVIKPPTAQLRAWQWNEQFKVTDGSWCCFVLENHKGELVGFAKGIPHNEPQFNDFKGELSKIYLLREYQRMGLGSRLMKAVVERFLQQGITSMLLFADAGNPSCRFYETLGAEKLYGKEGQFHGAYGWRNLPELLKRLSGAVPLSNRSSTHAES